MSDDKTINLTATINNQQYTVSYDIEEVKRIYDKLGISSAVQPSAVASVASTTEATTSTPATTATTAFDTGTNLDNTVKKNKVDELNKEIEKLFELRKNSITEICGKENIICDIDSDIGEDGAPSSLNIADIKAKDENYHAIEQKIEQKLEKKLQNDATKKFIYDIVNKIEVIKDELYNNEGGYIYKYC